MQMKQGLASATERETVGGGDNGERRIFQAEKAVLPGAEKRVEAREISGLNAAQEKRKISAAGERARMVAANDQRAKRLWNLFQSHADGGEHLDVIDRQRVRVMEA